MEMKGSRTEQNLMKAFAGESQARNRYSFFAEVAREEGYKQVADVFLETADNERAHGYVFFSLLDGGMPELTAAYPAGPVRSTVDNLRAAADGELMEWGTLYPDFAEVADEEGFKRAAAAFRRAVDAEKYHELRYRKLLENLEAGRTFKRAEPTRWKCGECGYVHEGTEAVRVCPLCGRPQAYFEVYCETY
jgi:rubrerythrin